ncbi:MAG TPA: glycosyltransferase family 4 protein [Chloroflexota bacterium]|nr:glycosyltransferase family 4 protein [Chloroflexota bacterium]
MTTESARPLSVAVVPQSGERSTAQDAPPRFHVQKIAPTPFFADYGCHVRIYEEAQALTRLGQQVVICTYPTGRDLDGLNIVRPARLGRPPVRVGSSRHKYYQDLLLTATAVQCALRRPPDVVHGHLHEGALIGLAISRTIRRPLVFDFQGSLTSEMVDHGFLHEGTRRYGFFRGLENLVNRHADAIITSSRPAADLLIREFGCPARKVIPVPDGVDTERFLPRAAYGDTERYHLRAALGIPAGRKVVVYLGLLAEYQGCSQLLEAACRVLATRRDVHFLLMGYPGEERYRAFAQRLGIDDHCTFTGRVPYERAPGYLALGDVAVAPKLSRTEANGKLLNYMALQLPTVAFDTSVNHDILGPAGVYAPLGDAEQFAEQLLFLLRDETEAAGRARALRQRVEQLFSWTAAARTIVDVYQRVSGR